MGLGAGAACESGEGGIGVCMMRGWGSCTRASVVMDGAGAHLHQEGVCWVLGGWGWYLLVGGVGACVHQERVGLAWYNYTGQLSH